MFNASFDNAECCFDIVTVFGNNSATMSNEISSFDKVETNMLEQDTVSVKTVNGFKSKLEKERSRRMGLFLDLSLQGLEAISSLEERPDL